RVAVGDLEDSSSALTVVRDAVGFLGADDELVAGPGVHDLVADLDLQALIQDQPQLVAELVVVLGGLVAGLDGDDADRGGLVERVGRHPPPRLVDDHVPGSGFGSRSRTSAVSIAAIAASQPLLPCLPPARSMACSNVSVVRTPNMMGTPVRALASRMPRAHSPAT